MNIERHQGDGAWVYADPALHDTVLAWMFDYGFNLAEFDDWVLAGDWTPDYRHKLLQWRQRAIDAAAAGNSDAVEGWLQFLNLLRKEQRRRAFLGPYAPKFDT